MSRRKLRIGFIGTGGIALNAHVPGWQSLPDVEIVAVADVRETAARGVRGGNRWSGASVLRLQGNAQT